MSISQNAPLTEAVYYILLSLSKPLHGYGIMQNIESLSQGRVRLAAGTLYGAINTMLEREWISTISSMCDNDNNRKKEYQITELGKSVVASETTRLEELLENGKAIIKGW